MQSRVRSTFPKRRTPPPPDLWNGKPLPSRNTVMEDIHYRIYDARTGSLLSFGSTNVLDGIAKDAIDIAREHPDAVLRVVQVDGPAY